MNVEGERCTELMQKSQAVLRDVHRAIFSQEKRAKRYQNNKEKIRVKYHEQRLQQLRNGLWTYRSFPNTYEPGNTLCTAHLEKQRANASAYKEKAKTDKRGE